MEFFDVNFCVFFFCLRKMWFVMVDLVAQHARDSYI